MTDDGCKKSPVIRHPSSVFLMKPKKTIPFDFVLDYLAPLDVSVKPMFGAYGVYVGSKIVLILRSRKDHPDANGVWLATSGEHHESLRKHFPYMRSISLFTD